MARCKKCAAPAAKKETPAKKATAAKKAVATKKAVDFHDDIIDDSF